MTNKTKTRGFRSIVGKTIKSINTTAVNSVVITFTDGTKKAINGENWWNGIPAITCDKPADNQ